MPGEVVQPLPSCSSCGALSGYHYSGCAASAMDRELERRREERRREDEQRRAQENANRPTTATEIVDAERQRATAAPPDEMAVFTSEQIERFYEQARRGRDQMMDRAVNPPAIFSEATWAAVDPAAGIPLVDRGPAPSRPETSLDDRARAAFVAEFQRRSVPCQHSERRRRAWADGSYQEFCASCGVLVGNSETLPVPEPPRTSADMPGPQRAQGHTVETVDGRLHGGVVYRCSCGWEVTRSYLEGMEFRDIQGMIGAHRAGGDVGPKQKVKVKFTYKHANVTCFNCERKPDAKMYSMEVLMWVCCDGALLMKPRRQFVFD